MKKITILTSIMMFMLWRINAQMGVNKDGTSPHPSAMLDIKASSTTNAKGLLMPRVADHTVITSPAMGLMIFNTTTNTFWYYNGLAWTEMGNDGAWLQNVNNVYTNSNNVGINTDTPQTTLDVKGNGFIVAQKTRLCTDDPNNYVQNMALNDVAYYIPAGTLYDSGGLNAPYPSVNINSTTFLYLYSCFRTNLPGCNRLGIKLVFEAFDTQANGDSLILTDGTNVLAKYSGNTLPPDFYFSGLTLGIRFKTNGDSLVGAGFKIKWQVIEKDVTITTPSISNVIGNITYFDALRGAFRSGDIGGNHAQDAGYYSVGMGYRTSSKGIYSLAVGNFTSAGSVSSVATGCYSNASGDFSTAMNYYTNASSTASFASGYKTISGGYASTSMGYYSNASGYASTALGNYANASGYNSTAIGTNIIASGFNSTALGYGNIAYGSNTTAMGSNAYAYNDGSFVIGDSPSSNTLYSQDLNSFNSRFRNGYYLYTSANMVTGVTLYGGSNSWSTVSDSTKKENFQAIEGENILKKIAKMRTVTWNYKGQDSKTFRHYGLMAQEFFSAFGHDKLGTIGNDTTIASSDFDGVSITAIKALEKRTQDLQLENELLKNRLVNLEKSNAEMVSLKAEVEQLRAFLLPNKVKIVPKNNAESKDK